MKKIILFFLLVINYSVNAQKIEQIELGADGYFGASSLGGSYGFGPKLGFQLDENWVVGPTFRYQRSWSSLAGQTFGRTTWGGGAFIHARFKNVVYLGAEFEYLKSPTNYVDPIATDTWVPTLFVGGGFSKEYNQRIRLNVGVYYDLIDNLNSPFRTSYMMTIKNEVGQVVKFIPVIYRISFVFPIANFKKENIDEEEE
ncbi:MAG: hypothetical protein KA521_09470 [Crocinitomicaceae bacterium]|nr:hypothetical protein [Crocinitomicaceae bacterium]